MASLSGIRDPKAFGNIAGNLRLSNYFQLASFVVLIYDHGLTIDDEIERIWKQPLSGASLLFLLNRYIQPLRTIIAVTAYHLPQWTGDACSNFVQFIAASSVAVTSICGLLMILRVYALYRRSNIILAVLLSLCVAQLVTSAMGITATGALQLPPGPAFVGCRLTPTTTQSWFAANWAAPLIFDGAIFFLTLWRTRGYIRSSDRIPVLHVLVRDGTLYFLVIFLVNLINAFLFFLAPGPLKGLTTPLSALLTSVMVSRLVLNLRSAPSAGVNLVGSATLPRPKSSIVFRTIIGNMGEDVETSRQSTSTSTNYSDNSRNHQQP